jgi:WYL_2, Sm-like SH3 beta-barrel fold
MKWRAEMSTKLKEVTDHILSSEGRVFSAFFIKKDGSTRHMTARLGVKKYVKGVGLDYDPYSKGLLPVFDMQKKEYRMINVNTIIETCVDGERKVWF